MRRIGVRSLEFGVTGLLFSDFFDQARSHSTDFLTSFQGRRTILKKTETKTDLQKRFELFYRPNANVQEARKVSRRSSSVALGNIAWNRHCRPSHLRTQPKFFFLGQALGQFVNFCNQVHRLFPDFQVLVATIVHLGMLPSKRCLLSQLPTPNFGLSHG